MSMDPTLPTFKNRFYQRVFLVMATMSLVSGLLTGGLGVLLGIKEIKAGRLNRGKEFALYLAHLGETAVIARDDMLISDAVKRLLGEPMVQGLAMYDATRTLLFSHGSVRPFPPTLKECATSTVKEEEYSRICVPIKGGVFDAERVTFGSKAGAVKKTKEIGYAVLDVSLAITQEERKRVAFAGLLLGGSVFLIGLFFSWVGAAHLSGPIRRIIKALDRMREGDYSVRVKVSTNDEMGKIADSFNRMARELESRLSELEQGSKFLESEVEKRTKEIVRAREFFRLLIAPLADEVSWWQAVTDRLREDSGAMHVGLYVVREGKWWSPAHSPASGPELAPRKDAVEPVEDEATLVQGFAQGARVLYYPLVALNQVQGQLVIVHDGTDFLREYIDQVAPALAMTISNVFSFLAVQKLVEELREKARLLEEQKAQVEEASRLKSEFFANVSHELRTPLNAIIGYGEMLAGGIYGEINDDQKEALKAIVESAQNLLNLINLILDHSRLEAGRLPLYVEKVDDMRELVRSVVSRNQALTRTKPYDLSLKLPSSPVPWHTDPIKVEQILTNLISNAVKFTDEGGVEVGMKLEGDRIHLWVKDTGIGIPKKELNRIFDPFIQVDGSSTREKGGTGLGLSVTSKLVKLMEGTIKVESQLGEGSTFHVWLPDLKHRMAQEEDG